MFEILGAVFTGVEPSLVRLRWLSRGFLQDKTNKNTMEKIQTELLRSLQKGAPLQDQIAFNIWCKDNNPSLSEKLTYFEK